MYFNISKIMCFTTDTLLFESCNMHLKKRALCYLSYTTLGKTVGWHSCRISSLCQVVCTGLLCVREGLFSLRSALLFGHLLLS